MNNPPTVFRTREQKLLERIALVRSRFDAKVLARKREKSEAYQASERWRISKQRAKDRQRARYWREDRDRRMASVHAAARADKVGTEAERLVALWNNQPKE